MSGRTMTTDEIRTAGIRALSKELGPVGMVRFLQQYETGSGNYTIERNEQLGNMSIHELARRIRESDSSATER